MYFQVHINTHTFNLTGGREEEVYLFLPPYIEKKVKL